MLSLQRLAEAPPDFLLARQDRPYEGYRFHLVAPWLKTTSATPSRRASQAGWRGILCRRYDGIRFGRWEELAEGRHAPQAAHFDLASEHRQHRVLCPNHRRLKGLGALRHHQIRLGC